MDLKAIGMGLAFAFIWSSAFTSARIIVVDAPPITVSAARFFIAGLIAVGIAFAMGQSWRLTRNQWRATIIFGVCQNALYLGLFFYAMQRIEASVAAIIASTMPLMVAIAGVLFLRERLSPMGSLGLIAGLVGVVLIMGTRIGGGQDTFSIILCVIGVMALTLATLSVRGASSGGNVMMVVGLQMLIGCAVLAVYAVLFEDWVVRWSPKLIAAFAYTTIMPGIVATWVWFTLVNRIGAVRAATFHFLNPFFGVAIAALLLGEAMTALDIVGVAIIGAGILAVQLDRQSMR